MSERYAIAVVGGGIHGVGVAQAAAAAGYDTLLLEQHDWASGTSSRSSKLIHGGLRYLQSGQFGLVRQALRERAILLRIAPELVRLVRFHIPLYRTSHYRPWQIRTGLSLYALLAGFSRQALFASVPRRHWDQLDGLECQGLRQVFRYQDAQTDDRLLTHAVLHSAQRLGAEPRCPATLLQAERDEGGYRLYVQQGAQQREARCRVLVNAGGPWVNEVLQRITPSPARLAIDWVQGTHLVLEERLSEHCYYLEAPRDQRAVFVMPWYGKTLIGTTETHYQGDPAAVHPLPAEEAYLLETLRHYFPHFPAVVSERFAGLRVLPQLPGSAFHRPRETRIWCDDPARPRLISLYGGKLTVYRAIAQRVVELAERQLGPRPRHLDTATLTLEKPAATPCAYVSPPSDAEPPCVSETLDWPPSADDS